jgi:hypothetical protein
MKPPACRSMPQTSCNPPVEGQALEKLDTRVIVTGTAEHPAVTRAGRHSAQEH